MARDDISYVRVPDELKEKYSDFPPIFKNTEITLADIGEHMQSYCRRVERKTGVKRSLIGSMHAQDILLLTPLVKEYMDMGLIIENIKEVIEFNAKSVFTLGFCNSPKGNKTLNFCQNSLRFTGPLALQKSVVLV